MPRTLRPRALATGLFIALAILMPRATPAQETREDGPTVEDIVEAWLGSAHADILSEAFRHWDGDGEIPGNCAVCHSSIGFRDYVAAPMSAVGAIDHPVPLGSGVDCAVCHSEGAGDLATVPFPSGETVAVAPPNAVCSVCHQGRAAGTTVQAATEGLEDDAVAPNLAFVNPHYAVSAATLLGSTVGSGYEYPDRDYAGAFTHVPELDSCTGCHRPHSLEVELETCTTCHAGASDFTAIRISPQDFDGDGDTTEGISAPITALRDRLGMAIQLYARDVAGAPVAYEPDSYPYFFADTDGDGAVSEGEAAYPNRYQDWTPRMLRAAYNYQYVRKNPGAYTHNPHYALQLLHDSLQDLAQLVEIDVSGLVRP